VRTLVGLPQFTYRIRRPMLASLFRPSVRSFVHSFVSPRASRYRAARAFSTTRRATREVPWAARRSAERQNISSSFRPRVARAALGPPRAGVNHSATVLCCGNAKPALIAARPGCISGHRPVDRQVRTGDRSTAACSSLFSSYSSWQRDDEMKRRRLRGML